MTVHFLIPGNLNSLTGGYLYNLHIIDRLKGMGHTVNILGTDWQWKDRESLEMTCRLSIEKLTEGSCVVIDSLILASLHRIVKEFSKRLLFLGLIHLPSSYSIHSGVHGKLSDEELMALQFMRQVIVTGKYTFDLLCNAGLDPAKIRTVEPGTDRFPRKKQYMAVPAKLLCISNYSYLKAQDLLIRALYRLTSQEWTLHLYGDTERDREYSASLRSLIQQLNLEQRVIMHGIVGRDELSAVFLDADLFIMPSLFESYGMTLTESLAHGIPVVTTRAGNIPHTVPDGMGLLTEAGNVEQLAAAIQSLFDNPEKYSALCDAASQYYRQARSWEHAAADFEKILLQSR